MPDAFDAELRNNLILASALFHTRPPMGRATANCGRVLRHALEAAGLWGAGSEDSAIDAFHGECEKFPEVQIWYQALIELTRKPRPERLLEGAGNLILPAGAFFTACWLTPNGKSVAEKLIAEQPEWKAKLTASGSTDGFL
jgi:hypothetical protein